MLGFVILGFWRTFPSCDWGPAIEIPMRHHDNPIFVVGQVVGAECWAYCLQNYVGDAKRCLRFFVGFQDGKPEVHHVAATAPENSHFGEAKSWRFGSDGFFLLQFLGDFKVPAAIQQKNNPKMSCRCCWLFFSHRPWFVEFSGISLLGE